MKKHYHTSTMRTKKNKTLIIILLVLLIALLAVNVFLQLPKKETIAKLEKSSDNPLSLDGYSKTTIEVQPTDVLLTKGCNAIILSTNPLQSYSIEQGIDKRIDYRPLTHDLIKEITEDFDIDVLMVKISEVRETTYYSEIFFKQGDKILNLDSRPTDAIAIAVREAIPIYVKDSILEKGVKIC